VTEVTLVTCLTKQQIKNENENKNKNNNKNKNKNKKKNKKKKESVTTIPQVTGTLPS
jgi:hypothetical protein